MEDLDILNHFSLDMVSTDMNFEEAYSMYNHLQQENALSAVENLQKMQTLNHTGTPSNFEYQKTKNLSMYGSDEDDSKRYEDEEDEEDEGEENEDFDRFFSNTESNALEKFLDNLAHPTNSNPLDLYKHEFNFQQKQKPALKADLTHAFAHPPVDLKLDSVDFHSSLNTQLPTPESRQSSIDEENDIYGDELDGSGKKRRSSSKPLLSLEQKRLNHSSSEQKRRQLCKLAYERCLRLITNFETYAKQPPVNRKSKRKQFNKDGLPNLSKHCALMKISHEMIKIKSKNDKLKELLNGSSI